MPTRTPATRGCTTAPAERLDSPRGTLRGRVPLPSDACGPIVARLASLKAQVGSGNLFHLNQRRTGREGIMKTLGTYLTAIALCAAASPAAAQWTRVDAVPSGFVVAVRSFGDTIVAGTTTLAYVSTDAGASWRSSQPAQVGVAIQSVLVRNGTLYVGTSGLGVFVSANLGQTWQAFNDGLVGGFLDSQLDVSDLQVRSDSLYASTFGAGVYVRRLNGVDVWHHFGEEFEPNQASNVRGLAVGGTRLLAAGGANGTVFFRDPGDADWTLSWLDNVGLRPGLEAFGAVWTGTGWVVATGVGRGVFSSAQGHEPWTAVNLGLGLLNSGTLTTRGPRVFGAFNRNNDVVIAHSGNDGLNWEVLDVLPQAFVFQIATVGTDLYAGRADGLWRRSTGTVSVPADGASSGLRLALAGAQPAAHDVRLRFNMPEAGNASIEIFDVAGRRAAELAQRSFSAGPHEVSWSARELDPGVYAVRLTVGQRQEVVRLVRVR